MLGVGVERTIDRIIRDSLNSLYLRFLPKNILMFHTFLPHQFMVLEMVVLKEEEIYIIGEFGQPVLCSNPIKPPLDHSTVNSELSQFLSGRQSSILLHKISENIKVVSLQPMNAIIVFSTLYSVICVHMAINQRISRLKYI